MTIKAILLAAVLAAPVYAAPQKCRVDALRPTQLAVGMQEVKEKEDKLSGMSAKKLDKYLLENPEPAVAGPGGELYIIDHHHLARALYDLGVKYTYCDEAADYSKLSDGEFWAKMEERRWVYAYDEYGQGPRPYAEIPRSVSELRDDPYRSLAGAVRKAGGYDKSSEPFAEFKWADFFRDKIGRKDLEADLEGCTAKGVKLAHSAAAAGLPGYNGSRR